MCIRNKSCYTNAKKKKKKRKKVTTRTRVYLLVQQKKNKIITLGDKRTFACRTRRVQYVRWHAMALPTLLTAYGITASPVPLCRGFVTTELAPLVGGRIGTDTGCAGCRRVKSTDGKNQIQPSETTSPHLQT